MFHNVYIWNEAADATRYLLEIIERNQSVTIAISTLFVISCFLYFSEK